LILVPHDLFEYLPFVLGSHVPLQMVVAVTDSLDPMLAFLQHPLEAILLAPVE
jgi:hypothetical protein